MTTYDPRLLRLVDRKHPVLRMVAQAVPVVNGEVRGVVRAMVEVMLRHNGVGLAAPQLGVPWRIVVVRQLPAVVGVPVSPDDHRVGTYINPVLIGQSDDLVAAYEGCLTLRGVVREIARPRSVMIEAIDFDGAPLGPHPLSGFAARVVQHECDHLEGKLITDHPDAGAERVVSAAGVLRGKAGGGA